MTTDSPRYGVVLPGGTATEQLELAVLAEEAGWDGVFSFELAYGIDPWTLLAAIAARTSRVRLGTMLTALPWRRPWKLASQVATLDQLSGGRAILGIGLGAADPALPDTGEVTGLRDRAERLDEGIDLIRALWDGQLAYDGQHYRYRAGSMNMGGAARPVQDRLPIWVVGLWPRPRSMRRVLRCDGLIPQYADEQRPGPEQLREARAWLAKQGAAPGLDVVADGQTPADDPAAATAAVTPWAQAGATWWLETRWGGPDDLPDRLRQTRDRIAAGPPGSSTPQTP